MLQTSALPSNADTGKSSCVFLPHKWEIQEEQHKMGLTDLYVCSLRKNNKHTYKTKELGVWCEFDHRFEDYEAGPTKLSRKSVRKSAPDFWELAGHSQAGLAGFLLDFTEHRHQIDHSVTVMAQDGNRLLGNLV